MLKRKILPLFERLGFLPFRKPQREISKRRTVKAFSPLHVYGPRNPIIGHFVKRSKEWDRTWGSLRRQTGFRIKHR